MRASFNLCRKLTSRSKEFADCPTVSSVRIPADQQPKEQTSRLLAMLKDLGMKGTPTLGKAKALKEKRELAQELGMWQAGG